MDPAAVALVLGAAVLHAAWNVRLHGADDRVAAMADGGAHLRGWCCCRSSCSIRRAVCGACS